eukprot:jgi/Picsp_1/594/NSC_00591-R1_protein
MMNVGATVLGLGGRTATPTTGVVDHGGSFVYHTAAHLVSSGGVRPVGDSMHTAVQQKQAKKKASKSEEEKNARVAVLGGVVQQQKAAEQTEEGGIGTRRGGGSRETSKNVQGGGSVEELAKSTYSDAAYSLHFDLEVDVSAFEAERSRRKLHEQLDLVKEYVDHCLQPISAFHLRLMEDVKQMKMAVEHEEGEVDVVILATRLSTVGHRVHLRNAIGGGNGSNCFRNLRNVFLIVEAEDVFGEDYVVEARFKDHFTISHPTERYAGVMNVVPEEIVAPASAIKPLVQLLCYEISLAFDTQGLSLPPWRHPKSLLSKWLPAKLHDVDMSTPGETPGGLSPRGSSPKGFMTPRVPPSTRGPSPTTGMSRVLSGADAKTGQLVPEHGKQQGFPENAASTYPRLPCGCFDGPNGPRHTLACQQSLLSQKLSALSVKQQLQKNEEVEKDVMNEKSVLRQEFEEIHDFEKSKEEKKNEIEMKKQGEKNVGKDTNSVWSAERPIRTVRMQGSKNV